MTATSSDDLIKHVLAARDATHTDIPDEFLKEVVRAVQNAGSDTEAAARAIEAAVTRALEQRAG